MYLGIPQLIYLLFAGLGLGVTLAKDGELKQGRYDFWGSLVSQIIIITILALGGFFSK